MASTIASDPMTEHVPTPHLTDPTILLTLTGPDRPGVSTALFDCLSAFALEVVDVEQLVVRGRSEEHTSELQSLMRISYAVFCLKKKNTHQKKHKKIQHKK